MLRLLVVSIPLALAGCLSISSDSPRPPASNTVVVPAPARVCPNGAAPPC
jgi:hypothetical protein